MNTKEVSKNLKLGAFVLGGIILFFAAVFLVGAESNLFNKTFTVYAVFKNVEGLKVGDNVWLSGVKIGTVKEVRIMSVGRVIVTLALKDQQNEFIKKNSTAFIGSDGLVGNKIVVVRPGTSMKSLADQDTIGALSPADTQELINIARDVGQNTKDLTTDLKELTSKINNGKGIVGEFLNNGDIADDIRSIVREMKNTTNKTAQASEQLASMVYKMNNGNGLLNKLATDTMFVKTFDDALVNVKEVSKNTKVVSENLSSLASKMNDSDNAVGVLLADSLFADKLRMTMDNAEQASSKLNENMEALRGNFLFRRYFKKKDKREQKEREESEKTSDTGN